MTTMGRRDLLAGAGTGLLAATAGLGAGHLTASVLVSASSPVLAVGATVIDATPTPVKEWAVRTLGTADKPVLLASVVVVTLLLACAGGILARRNFAIGAILLVALVCAAGAAAVTRPASTPADVLPSIVTAIVALAVLRVFSPVTRTSPADGPGRRRLLIGAGAVAGAAVVAGAAGQWLIQRAKDVTDIVLPRPAQPLGPLPPGLERQYRGVTPFRTANEDFYRIDVNLSVPVVDERDWRLRIDGMVERPFDIGFDDLLALPMIERDITLNCVSNYVGGEYISSARWLGVPIATLLDRAGVQNSADQILSTAVDGFTISTPLAVAQDGRDMMVAVAMNGVALPRQHGFPARLITPGLYGYVGATKWLERLTLTTYADQTAYWTDRGWATDGPVKISSRIDTPQAFDGTPAGRVVVAGVAWAQHQGIGGVEVKIDDQPWQPAELGPDVGIDYWRQWYLLWDAEPGNHTLAVRAIALDGSVQTAKRATPFPDGASGIQRRIVKVD